jgi:hypothetical protein
MLDIIKNTEGAVIMDALGHLEKMLLAGEITEEEYKERKFSYIETLLELYIKGIISKEKMQEKLNK